MKIKGEIKMKRNLEIIEGGKVVNENGMEVDLTNRDCRFDQIRELKQENKMLKKVILAMSFVMFLMIATVAISIKGAMYSEELVELSNERIVVLEKQTKAYDLIVNNLKAEKEALLKAGVKKNNNEIVYYNTKNGRKVDTYIKYSDTIISSGSVIRQYEIEDSLVTIYADSVKSLDDLNQKLGYEYYTGRGEYIDAILQINGVYLINY